MDIQFNYGHRITRGMPSEDVLKEIERGGFFIIGTHDANLFVSNAHEHDMITFFTDVRITKPEQPVVIELGELGRSIDELQEKIMTEKGTKFTIEVKEDTSIASIKRELREMMRNLDRLLEKLK